MVNMKTWKITLEAHMIKDKEKRIIPISESLCITLKGIIKATHDDHVLLFRCTQLKALGKALQRACEKAGIIYGRFKKDGFVFHDLRHSFNTNMRKAGVAESVIMAITGHSTIEMFLRYDTVDEDDTRNAIDPNEKRTQSN